MDEECTIGPLKKAALGSGPLRTCDGLSSTILPGLVRNVAHALSEGVKHTHRPNSKQKHGQAWETPTDSGKGRWMMTAVPGSSHGQHSLSLGPVGLSLTSLPTYDRRVTSPTYVPHLLRYGMSWDLGSESRGRWVQTTAGEEQTNTLHRQSVEFIEIKGKGEGRERERGEREKGREREGERGGGKVCLPLQKNGGRLEVGGA